MCFPSVSVGVSVVETLSQPIPLGYEVCDLFTV